MGGSVLCCSDNASRTDIDLELVFEPLDFGTIGACFIDHVVDLCVLLLDDGPLALEPVVSRVASVRRRTVDSWRHPSSQHRRGQDGSGGGRRRR